MQSEPTFFDKISQGAIDLWSKMADPVMAENNPRVLTAYYSIPFVGPVFHMLKELDLSDQINNEANPVRKATLLDRKNEVTRCGLTSLIVHALAIVAILALCGAAAAILPCLFLVGIGASIHALRLSHNEDIMRNHSHGLPMGIPM